ncbi:unnamed protein product [Urochloa humidicola]
MDNENDDILRVILERVDSHLMSLIRATTTCKRWRRTIADSGFLRHYRSLHGPTIAGHYFDDCSPSSSNGDHPLFFPSSPPSPLINAYNFSLDFMPWKAGPTYS